MNFNYLKFTYKQAHVPGIYCIGQYNSMHFRTWVFPCVLNVLIILVWNIQFCFADILLIRSLIFYCYLIFFDSYFCFLGSVVALIKSFSRYYLLWNMHSWEMGNDRGDRLWLMMRVYLEAFLGSRMHLRKYIEESYKIAGGMRIRKYMTGKGPTKNVYIFLLCYVVS